MDNRKLFILPAIFALIIGFSGGIWFERTQPSIFGSSFESLFKKPAIAPSDVDMSLFWEVWNSLHSKYVDQDQVTTQKLIYGAIKGMVDSVGDPYTVFFEPVTSQKFQDEIKGEFGGVGIELGRRNDVLTVISPIKDSPAWKAGIKSGDKIIKVDGKTTEGMSIEEAVNTIRGTKGTLVVLTISNGLQRDVSLIRDTIKVPTVELTYHDNNSIARIAVYSFNQNADSEFKKAAESVLKSGAQRIILDLRNNPGGLLDSAVELAGWFLDSDSLVTTESFGNGEKDEFRTSGNASLRHLPVVILINGGSASASEILAGAIHDNRGVKLVGVKTFGKGSVQQLESFGDGSSLKVTVAKWLTPAGVSISEKGIEADVVVEIKDQDILDGKIEGGVEGKDPQLDKAIEIIKGL